VNIAYKKKYYETEDKEDLQITGTLGYQKKPDNMYHAYLPTKKFLETQEHLEFNLEEFLIALL